MLQKLKNKTKISLTQLSYTFVLTKDTIFANKRCFFRKKMLISAKLK